MTRRLSVKLPRLPRANGAGLVEVCRRFCRQKADKAAGRWGRKKSCLVIRFGKDLLECVATKGNKDKQPLTLVRDLSGVRHDRNAVRRLLREIMEELAVQSAQVTLVLDQEEVLTRTLHMPVSDPGEIAAMIPFQAEAILPLPLDEFILNHNILGQDDSGKTKVLLEAVPCNLVAEKMELLASCGLSVAEVRSADDLTAALGGECTELIPPALLLGRQEKAQRRSSFLSTLLVLYCLVVVTFVTEYRISTRRESRDELQGYLQATEESAHQLIEMKTISDRLANQNDKTGILDLLAVSCSAAPPGIMVFEVALVRDESTVIHGQVETPAHALDFVEALKKLPGCQDAVLEFAGSRGRDPGGGTTFEIKIEH